MTPGALAIIPKIISYFDRQVLAFYRERSHQYEVWTDHFEGQISTRGSADAPYVNVSFGFRQRKDGDLAVAAYMPDLNYSPQVIIDQWLAFQLGDAELADLPDPRFELWVDRYIEGDWDVPNGPLTRVRESIEAINNLCIVKLGIRLFKSKESAGLEFPKAQNTHAYEDAHVRVYGLVVDGLEKQGLAALAQHLNVTVNAASSNRLLKIPPAAPAGRSPSGFKPLEKPVRSGLRAPKGRPQPAKRAVRGVKPRPGRTSAYVAAASAASNVRKRTRL